MTARIEVDLTVLDQMTVNQLRKKYQELFKEPTASRHRQWLVRRIAWRLQALAEGGLPERARRRASELARESDLRVTPSRSCRSAEQPADRARRDRRLPSPGTVLTRRYKGRQVQVTVGQHSFQYEGKSYGSLSAVARAVTGSHCNGYHFFRLGKHGVNA